MAGVYLRAGLIGEAARRTAVLAGQTGDDPDLRGLLVAAAKPDAAATDYLALARRFLPRIEFLGGTATEAPDPVIALRVLDAGIARHPGDAELLVLSSHVSRLLSSYFLAIRRLEEAQMVLEHTPNAAELTGRVSAELIELYFLRLRLRLDPERDAPAYAEADALKQRFAETRQRFQSADMKVKPADIDFELARSYVNAGQIDRAEPLFLRAREEGEPTAEVTVELANLALKRGDPARAAQIIREGLDAIRGAQNSARDTIGSVEGRARLERLLGDCTDAAGDHAAAEAAWRSALIGWERLMIEHLRRKNLGESAEAAVEVGRLLYVLGRHAEGLQKFDEAIEEDGDRDQTYIDVIAFLVQHGETDAAISVYHRGAVASGPRRVRVREGLHLAVGAGPVAAHGQDRGAEGRGLPAHAGAPPRRPAPAPRRRLVPPARPLRGRSDDLRADAGGRGHQRQARRDLFLRRHAAPRRRQVRRRPRPVAEGDRHAHVLVLRVRDGLALPARRRPHDADGARHSNGGHRDHLNHARPCESLARASLASPRRAYFASPARRSLRLARSSARFASLARRSPRAVEPYPRVRGAPSRGRCRDSCGNLRARAKPVRRSLITLSALASG